MTFDARTQTQFAALALLATVAASACTHAVAESGADDSEQKTEALGLPPTTLASAQMQPTDVVIDSANVYWTNAGEGIGDASIFKVSKSGGKPVALATKQNVPFGIAVDSTQVYWVNYDSGGANGAVMAVPTAGGTPKVLAVSSEGPRSIVVDSSKAYYLISNAVMAVSKSGGTPTTVASTQCGSAIAQDDTRLYWMVNCVMFPPQGIFSVAKSGGVPVKLTNEAPGKFVVDDRIYWTSDDKLMAMPKNGGTAVRIGAVTNASGPLAFDAYSFYAGANNSVVKVSRFTGLARTIATGPSGVGSIAVDGLSIYWSSFGIGDGKILKTYKF